IWYKPEPPITAVRALISLIAHPFRLDQTGALGQFYPESHAPNTDYVARRQDYSVRDRNIIEQRPIPTVFVFQPPLTVPFQDMCMVVAGKTVRNHNRIGKGAAQRGMRSEGVANSGFDISIAAIQHAQRT